MATSCKDGRAFKSCLRRYVSEVLGKAQCFGGTWWFQKKVKIAKIFFPSATSILSLHHLSLQKSTFWCSLSFTFNLFSSHCAGTDRWCCLEGNKLEREGKKFWYEVDDDKNVLSATYWQQQQLSQSWFDQAQRRAPLSFSTPFVRTDQLWTIPLAPHSMCIAWLRRTMIWKEMEFH
jgi:hypothetical protein